MVGRATLAFAYGTITDAPSPTHHRRRTTADGPPDDIIRHLFRTHDHGPDASRSRSIAHYLAALYWGR